MAVNPYTGEVLEPDKAELERSVKTSAGQLDEMGRLMPDPVPLEPPIGYVRQPSLAEQIREMVRSERLRQEMDAAGVETFDESDDFDVGDDYDPSSPYEADFEPLSDVRARKDAAEAAEAAAAAPPPTKDLIEEKPSKPPKKGATPPVQMDIED